MDNVQSALEGSNGWRISILPIEATAPKLEEATEGKQAKSQQATREEIYSDVATGARLDRNFIVMVILSTIVATIGLNSDGVAAVIGAMVIAPLLGPVLGFSMGAALGDDNLLKKSTLTLAAGIGVALALSLALSFVLPINLESRELMTRAEVRLDGLALAMAAGGAAALSLTSSQASALVGVMVAAALLPPGAAVGLFAGAGRMDPGAAGLPAAGAERGGADPVGADRFPAAPYPAALLDRAEERQPGRPAECALIIRLCADRFKTWR
jgi:uncharacterized hydrophobic protein (TIGR00341 family)